MYIFDEIERLITATNASDRQWNWSDIKVEDGFVYVPETANLGDTTISVNSTYENAGLDCLLIQTVMNNIGAIISAARRGNR